MSGLTDTGRRIRQSGVRAPLPMQDGKVLHAPARSGRAGIVSRVRKILLRRLWLPRFIYEALPYLYIACGLAALGSAIHTPDWTWILPWAILVGLICLHAALALATLRYRIRKGKRENAQTSDPHD